MDLKLYYQKIRDTESRIPDEFPIIASEKTDDGGKAGIYAEVTREVAAKMMTEGTARLATVAETKAYREERAESKQAADDAAEVSKVQVTVVPNADLTKVASRKMDMA
jgi:hypothetical protein